MESSYLFSIGHGNKSIAEFIAELAQFDIQYLIDIRSKPYSKFYPWFNHYELKHAISETHQITYAYMGDVLGGLPKEDCGCYTDGKVDYSKLAQMDFFQKGLQRLVNAHQQGYKTCIMCSESDPCMCHRTKLIGEELRKFGITLQHIYRTKDGRVTLISQAQAMANVLNNDGRKTDLFHQNEEINLTSRKQYV